MALAAALLHDLGHGPFSHTFETVLPRARPHEAWTSQIILDPNTEVHALLREFDAGAPEAVERLIHGKCPIRHLARAVSGTFDVDRCDYLMRDSHMTGVRYGLLDLDWLMASLRLYLPAGASAATLAIDPGETVELTFNLPLLSSPVVAKGEVRWVDADTCGVQFIDLSPRVVSAINRLQWRR